MRKRISAFTLLEVLMVVVIVVILAAIFVPIVSKAKQKSLDREAIVSLKLIAAAERIYRLERGNYLTCADEGSANTNLKLFLPTASKNWNYKVDVTAAGFTAKAQSATDDNRVWCADQTGNDPTRTGCSW
jgi:prepilin-type N-terminal cleavage/methylation domain-containing protein